MLVLFHITLEIPLLSFTHSARAHRMCPFRMTQRAPCALFLNAPLPLFQAAGNPIKSANPFMRYSANKHFLALNLVVLSPTVTLKIRSRSPKPNQLFIMFQCYIHANLVKIWQPVHEILCKQERVMPMLTWFAPKIVCPKPLSVGGHNYSSHKY